jgi:hypothetical protein
VRELIETKDHDYRQKLEEQKLVIEDLDEKVRRLEK